MICDILVVGAGIAGWTAAGRAVELGADVLLIDKAPRELGDGNSLMTSGSFRAAGKDPKSDPGELYRQAMKEGVAHGDLARAWADNCSRSVDWLRSRGVEVTGMGRAALEPRSSVSLAPVYKKDVGTNVLRKLKASFIGRGGRYSEGIEAERLRLDDAGSVTGVTARRGREGLDIESKATLLTTGGFSANREMLRKYIGAHAGECKLRGSSSDTGDGLRMALAGTEWATSFRTGILNSGY